MFLRREISALVAVGSLLALTATAVAETRVQERFMVGGFVDVAHSRPIFSNGMRCRSRFPGLALRAAMRLRTGAPFKISAAIPTAIPKRWRCCSSTGARSCAPSIAARRYVPPRLSEGYSGFRGGLPQTP